MHEFILKAHDYIVYIIIYPYKNLQSISQNIFTRLTCYLFFIYFQCCRLFSRMPKLLNRRGQYAKRPKHPEPHVSTATVEGTVFGRTIHKRGMDVPFLEEYAKCHEVDEDFTSTSDIYEDWKRLVHLKVPFTFLPIL